MKISYERKRMIVYAITIAIVMLCGYMIGIG